MASERYEYQKTVWTDRVVERPRTYTETTNSDGSVTHTPAVGNVIQEGTPRDAEHMNKVEDGIEYAVDAVNDLVDRVDVVEEDLAGHIADKNNPHQVTFWAVMAAALGIAGITEPTCSGVFTGTGKTDAAITVDGKSVYGQKIITKDANDVAFTPRRVLIFIPWNRQPMDEDDLFARYANKNPLARTYWLMPEGYVTAIDIGPGRNYFHSGCPTNMGTATAGEMLARGHGGAGVTADGFVVGSYNNMDTDGTMHMNEKGKKYPWFAWK